MKNPALLPCLMQFFKYNQRGGDSLQRANELRLAYEHLMLCILEKIRKHLSDRDIVDGCMPTVHWMGYGQQDLITIFENIGPSLQELFEKQNQTFSNLTIFYFMEKMVILRWFEPCWKLFCCRFKCWKSSIKPMLFMGICSQAKY